MASLQQFHRDLTVLERRLASEIALAESDTLNLALKKAHDLSDGGLSEFDLIAMDHPYAKRHGMPQVDPGIINKHTGEFDAGWKTLPLTVSSGVLHSTLINFSRVADFLQHGTRYMFARPIDAKIAQSVAAQRLRNLDRAVRRAFKRFS